MTIQPEELVVDNGASSAFPKRIEPGKHGGAQSRKFAQVGSALTLLVGTPVAYDEALDAFVAWDPNTSLGTDVNEVQEITFDAGVDGGTFRLGFLGAYTAAIAWNANAATIETAFEGLATVGAGNGTISGGTLPGTPVVITFTGTLAGAPQDLVELDGAALTDGGLSIVGGVITRLTPGNTGGAVNEVITIDEATGTVTAGTFTITFDGQTTTPIAWDASAATVLAAVIALSNVPAGAFTAGGGALPGTAVTLTAAGAFLNADLPAMTVDSTGLTGGTISAVTTTEGDTEEGAAAPAGEIVGFVFPKDIVLSTTGEVFGVIMMKGLIHRDEIVLPSVGSPTNAQLDEALRDGLLERGILVEHLTNVH